MKSELVFKYGKTTKGESASVVELCAILCQIIVNVDRRDPLYEQTRDSLTSSDVEDWVDVENNSDVMEAQIDDDILEADISPTLSNKEAPSSDSCDDDQTKSHPLPPLSSLIKHFTFLENAADHSNVKDAGHFLRKARSTFFFAAKGGAVQRLLRIGEVLHGTEKTDSALELGLFLVVHASQ